MASTMSTPGMMGRPGKCPAKNGSLMVTFLIATIRTLRFKSRTRSISKNGYRWGRIFRMSWMSSAIFVAEGEGSGTGVLSFMFVSNWFVSKRLEDYNVRLAPEGSFHTRAGDERKDAGQKNCTLETETNRNIPGKPGMERPAALFRSPAGTDRADDPRVCGDRIDRKSTRLNSSHLVISYAVF